MSGVAERTERPAVVPPFTNHLPVKVAFGDGTAGTLGAVAESEWARRLFVAIDAGLEDAIAPVAEVLARLERAGIELVRFAKQPGEPTTQGVLDAAAALAEAAPDMVVAIGGGSVIDTAKIARCCAAPDGPDVAALLGGERRPPPPTWPLVCLPTTAGTGSEVSGGAVVLDPATHAKVGVAHPNLRAQHALVDPVLTHTLPRTITAHTGIDALAQAIAAIVARTRTPIGNGIALEATRLLGRSLLGAALHGDPVARSETACGSVMAGLAMNISDCAAEHSLGQALGAMFELSHGETIGLVLAETLERERRHVPELLERVADALGVPDDGSADGSRAVAGVRWLLERLELRTLREVGVTPEHVPELVDRTLSDFFITQSPEPWSRDEVREAFESGLALDASRAPASGDGT